jgi:hypothetical protein
MRFHQSRHSHPENPGVLDGNFDFADVCDSGSVSNSSGCMLELNRRQIGSPGWQYTGSVDLGTVQSTSPYQSELGGSSECPPPGPSVTTYTALAFPI